MKKILFFICTLLCANVLMAQDFYVNGVGYAINGDEVSVIGYDSNLPNELEIPSTVEYNETTYSVTFIKGKAFYQSNLTSVTIPNTVTAIGTSTDSYGAFEECNNLTSITIPNSVTILGKYTFYSCDNLTSVTFETNSNLITIGSSAFYYCSSLASIDIPNSVTSIGNSAFYYCSRLTSIDIPNSVTSIGDWAFSHCSSLTSLTIPNSVTSIGDYAFSYCSSLTSITIPNSVTSIGRDAFYYCSSLTSITIPNSVTSIGNSAFSHCSSLTSITIPKCSSIGDWTFSHCSSLASIDIPNSVTSIGYGAFENCSSLTSITIPNSVTSIGNSAFYYCSSLMDIYLLTNTATIPTNAFEGNIGGVIIDDVYYGTTNTTLNVGPYTFENTGFARFHLGENTYSATITDGLAIIDCKESKSGALNIPSSVEINGTAYSVTSIGDEAFRNCSSLTSVTIPNSVTSIGVSAFNYCSRLTSVNIPNSVTSIGYYAFYYCSSLTSIDIPNSVTSIGKNAFRDCSSLDSVTCLKETAPSLGNNVFYSTPSTKVLNIPFGSDYSSWQGATTWSKTNYQIQEGKTKILETDFTINDTTGLINQGVLRIKQGGQLINLTTDNVSGIFEVETKSLPTDKWSFIGAPFAGYKLEAVKQGSKDISVSTFDYNTGNWSNDWATIDTWIGAGEGFFAWSFAEEPTIFTTYGDGAETYNFETTPAYSLNNGGVFVSEALTTHQEGGNWMALANPYTFKLDISKFLKDQSNIKGGVVYRFNGETWTTTNTGAIDLTEGFFVNFTSNNNQIASFVKSHRYTGASSKAEKKKEYISLYMQDGERTTKLLITQNEEAEQGDDLFDANKLFSPLEITEPYFVTDGVALVKEEVKELPYYATLNIKNYDSKEVTFRVDNIPEDVYVYLLDNGQDIKMNGGVEYTTNIAVGENEDRFKLLIKKARRIAEEITTDIYVHNSNRYVTITTTQKDLKIEAYNTLGQKVFETNKYNFYLDNVPSGTYILKIHNKHARKNAKIVIE